MTDWTRLRGAPAEGTVVCPSADVPEGGTKCLRVGRFPLLLVRDAAGLRAFVNACPHQWLELDRQGDGVLSADGRVLRCTNHQAGFDARTGAGVDGLGVGHALTPVPVAERDGTVVIG
jgi:nitrite reductase/ring-hydroxylating ferredoxin subunit